MPENLIKRESGCIKCCFCKFSSKKSDDNQKDNANNVTVENKNAPFLEDLPKDLIPGTCIGLKALIKPDCYRFTINLLVDKNKPNSDIAFHLNPRLLQRYIVRNCRINGHWGDEETTSASKFHLERNTIFELNIFITDREFYILLNGRHVCAFVFRLPLTKVTAIEVLGSIEVQGVEYKKLKMYPPEEATKRLNAPFAVPQGTGQDEISIQQLELPVTGLLPRGFQPGWQLEIYGRVKILPHTFYINLQEGSHLWPHPVIPLHLNPRFSTTLGKRLFVRNAWIDGGWGQEERVPGFQFSPGSPFSIAIRCGDDHFSVWVDGQLVGEFKFRTAIKNIDTLYINGDVTITSIYMNTLPKKTFN